MRVGNKMNLKITYIDKEPGPKKKVNWRKLPAGTVFKIGSGSLCLKTDDLFIILPVNNNYGFLCPIFPEGHMWDNNSVKVLGKLTGIEVTRE